MLLLRQVLGLTWLQVTTRGTRVKSIAVPHSFIWVLFLPGGPAAQLGFWVQAIITQLRPGFFFCWRHKLLVQKFPYFCYFCRISMSLLTTVSSFEAIEVYNERIPKSFLPLQPVWHYLCPKKCRLFADQGNICYGNCLPSTISSTTANLVTIRQQVATTVQVPVRHSDLEILPSVSYRN